MKGLLKVVLSSIALLTLASCVSERGSNSLSVSSQNNDPVYYDVTFLNYDDTFLYKATVEEGHEAQYIGETPTREEDDEFTYEFVGWDHNLQNITEELTVTAQYNPIPKEEGWGPIIK